MRAVAAKTSIALILALTGCSTLAPDVQITGAEKYPISRHDVREIERLVPMLGIRRPIDRIDMEGPDRATVWCLTRPVDFERTQDATVSFTVVRKNGRWIAVDKPVRGPLHFTI